VWDSYLAGRIADIRAYCETDVVNTYLLWLRYQLMRGRLDRTGYDAEIARVRDTLEHTDGAHWKAFLLAWADAAAR
jgi:hypothetical protein